MPIEIRKGSPRRQQFSPLRPGQIYRVSLAVVSGSTQSSKEDAEFTTHPLPVYNITASPNDPHSLKIWWSSDPQSLQDEYNVTYQGEFVDTGTHVTRAMVPNTVLSGLFPGERYYIDIRAVSNSQSSQSSNSSSIKAVTYPYNPKTFRAPTESITTQSVKLVWDFDAQSSHNTGWKITFSNRTGLVETVLLDVSEDTSTVTDLHHFHEYIFSIHGIAVDNTVNVTGLALTVTTEFDPCFSKPCQNNGQCSYRKGLFKCMCAEGYAGRTCNETLLEIPNLIKMNPHFGPEAGGTVLTIVGKDLIAPVEGVFIGGQKEHECSIRSSDKTRIEAVTPPFKLNDTAISMPVVVDFPGGSLTAKEKYEYRKNPVVKRIEPLSSILEGGTIVSVKGTSMDSVKIPILEVTMVFGGSMDPGSEDGNKQITKIFEHDCEIDSRTLVLCNTPRILLPGALITPHATTTDYTLDSENDRTIVSAARSLQDDQSSQGGTLINYDNGETYLTFYLGLQFDGLQSYRNLSVHSTLNNYSILEIHHTPEIHQSKDIIDFEPNIPVQIEGSGMDGGVAVNDYKVYIGADECQIISLMATNLTCMPPQREPRKLNSSEAYHVIQVHIGTNIRIDYGRIQYHDKQPIYVWILVGVLIPVTLAAVIIAVIFVLRRKRRLNSETKHYRETTTHERATPNIYEDILAWARNSRKLTK